MAPRGSEMWVAGVITAAMPAVEWLHIRQLREASPSSDHRDIGPAAKR